MAFQRNHVSDAERVAIGLHVFRYKSMYGLITDLARKYLVSRWFIYSCYFQFLLLLDLQKENRESLTPQYGCCQNLEEQVLSPYLETEASISGIKRCLKNLVGQEVSAGRISEILNEYGGYVGSRETVTVRVKFISDEIFISTPILVTVEPVSDYILGLDLAESRDKETWGACWLELVDNETGQIERIIADQAKGLVGGIELVCDDPEQRYQSDLFHVIMRLVAGMWRAERKAYAAIGKEYEAADKFARAKRERVFAKRLNLYETAKAQADQWIRRYDESVYLFRELQEVLRMVDLKSGDLRRKADVMAELEAILELFEMASFSERKACPFKVLLKMAALRNTNRLKIAMLELGKACRSIFLLKLGTDLELHSEIQRETLKGERWHKFGKEVFIGHGGKLQEDSLEEQSITLLTLNTVLNSIAFWNTLAIQKIVKELRAAGYSISQDNLRYVTPTMTDHIDLIGKFEMNFDRQVPFEFNLKEVQKLQELS